MDACPNLNLFTKMPSLEITKPEETAKSVNDRKVEVLGARIPATTRRIAFSRSLSLDRSSRIESREARERSSRNRDLRVAEKLSRSRTRLTDDESDRLRESRFRAIAQSRDTGIIPVDPAARLSRSRDLSNERANDRRAVERRSLNVDRRLGGRANRRSRAATTEQRRSETEEIANGRGDRSTEIRRNSAERRIANRERRSLSAERRAPSELGRRESRQIPADRRESRDREARGADRRSVERRAIEHRQDAERSSRREDRSARSVRRLDVDRNNNPDRRSRERSVAEKTRRVPLDRVASRERASRLSIAATGDSSRKDPAVASNVDRKSALSRTTERRAAVDDPARETLGARRARSAEAGDERSLARAERRAAESRLRLDRRSHVDRATSRVASADDSRRERTTDRSRRAITENSRERSRARSRYDLEEKPHRERRERLARASGRSLDRNSLDRRELSRITGDIARDGDRRSRDSSRESSSLERRERTLERSRGERTDRSYRSRVERRQVVLRRSSRSSGEEDGTSERRRAPEGIPERRASRERLLERRSSVPESRDSSAIGARRSEHGSSRSRAATRMLRQDASRRAARSLELPDPIYARTTERRAARSSVVVDRSITVPAVEREPAVGRAARRRTSNPEQSRNREQRRLSVVSLLSRAADDQRSLVAKWDGNLQETRVDRHVEARAVAKNSLKNDQEFLKQPATYELVRQAVVAALCTAYGLSLYNGKKSLVM